MNVFLKFQALFQVVEGVAITTRSGHGMNVCLKFQALFQIVGEIAIINLFL
jgi:hypothetical protein